jgi:hypothetical protein
MIIAIQIPNLEEFNYANNSIPPNLGESDHAYNDIMSDLGAFNYANSNTNTQLRGI